MSIIAEAKLIFENASHCQMSDKLREKNRRFRELNPNYNKQYADKIKDTFIQKYAKTIATNNANFRENNKDYHKNRYLYKKQCRQFCNIDIY